MKIIDFEKKGNVVRFYLGQDNLEDWYGDDWNDRPYEYNAGTVYDEFLAGYRDIAFDFDSVVLEPKDDYENRGNSKYCKDDMRNRDVPCIIVVPDDVIEDNCCRDEFNRYVGSDRVTKFYFGDRMEPDYVYDAPPKRDENYRLIAKPANGG